MRLRKVLFIIGGLIAFGLGTLGIFLPLLPTVPLYLLTLILFANSSDRLHAWYVKTGLYKRFLLPYLKAGGLTRRYKTWLIIFVSLQILIAAFLVRKSVIGLSVCALLWLGFISSMLFIVRTVELPGKEEQKNRDER